MDRGRLRKPGDRFVAQMMAQIEADIRRDIVKQIGGGNATVQAKARVGKVTAAGGVAGRAKVRKGAGTGGEAGNGMHRARV